MRNNILAFLSLSFIVLFSCNRHSVSLSYTNANKEVRQLENLVFRFSSPLASDSMINKWDSTEYVSFEPDIQGRFRWSAPDELVFSPASPLAPATSYKASVNDVVLKHSKFGVVDKGDEIKFHTAPLRLEHSNVTWVLIDETTRSAVPQLELFFNYPVAPSALKEKLVIESNGKPLSYNINTVSPDNKITLRLMNFKQEDRDHDINITIDKGIKPVGGTNALDEKQSLASVVPSPYVLVINSVESDHDGTSGSVHVKTSQQIASGGLTDLVRVDPSVRFTTEITDDGFIVSSEQFSTDKSYELILAKGIRGKIGGQLREEHTSQVAFGEMQPTVQFTNSEATYLSSQGHRNIELKIVNTPRIKVIISKVYENNLITAQRYGYYPAENPDEEGAIYEDASEATFGDIIFEQEIDTRSLPRNGKNFLYNFNINDRLPDFKGIYHIRVRSMQDYWLSDNRFISFSDIGLISKEGKDKIIVFANSIHTTQPLRDISLVAYGGNNQVIGMATTNNDGIAEINYTRKDFKGFKPMLLVAKGANDFNYLLYSQSAINTSRFEVGGKRINTTGLDAFVYGERDIYRPGEKVNFGLIVRDRNWKSPGTLPLKFKVLLPTGRELISFRKSLNEQGGLDGSFEVSASALTGSYNLEVYTGNDVLITSKPFMIEEFVPDRIKLITSLQHQELKPSETTQLTITATNFFGPPAAGRNYETEIQVKQIAFNSKKFKNYNFQLANQQGFFETKLVQGKTSDQGTATVPYEVPSMFKNVGLLQTSFFTTVFDETGRPVSRTASLKIHTQPYLLGIGEDGYDYFALNQPARFPIIALDKNDNIVSGATATIQVIKHEYRTVLSKTSGYFRYNSQKEEKVVASSNIRVSGDNTTFAFTPRSPGTYEIRAFLPGAGTYVSRQFYSYGYWGGDQSSFAVNTDGQIDIASDKDNYNVGDKIKLLFKTPFAGKMLVTVEQGNVLHHQYLDVEKRTATLELPITEAHLPNAYITATLFKRHEVSDIPLTVAHGFQSISVRDEKRSLPVTITAPQSVRSRTKQKVSVRAEAGSMITLAAVDNGVLQVTDFKTPDPYKHFYSRRALEVNAYDIYPLLFPEIASRSSSTGGDGELKMDQRVNPMPNKRIKILSFWSGVVPSKGGAANFEIEIPQFSGEVRLMAVAYKNDRFGAAEHAMKVADPIVLSSSIARFLSPGDTMDLPVTMSNTTKQSTNATASINVSGPLSIIGTNSMSATIPANSESKVRFKVAAEKNFGIAKITINTKSGSEIFREETDITIRPASTLQKRTGSGVITANKSQSISINTSDFISNTSRYNLIVSRSPVIELASQLKYLVQYPYGCTEQVISSAFPQLYFADIAAIVGTRQASSSVANQNIMEAIRTIRMRQLYNGAVTMWDNEGTENWWATIYAAHFLIEAKKAGYDVEPSLLETLLAYVNNRLSKRTTINYYYNRDQQKKIAPKEVPYSLYVLSIAGRPNIASMNYYRSRPELLALDGKYLLASGFALAGDKAALKHLLPASFTGEESVPQTGGSFYSDIRDEAIALNALIEVDPANPQVPVMARHVIQKLKSRRWYSTQESSFSLLALGKIAAKSRQSDVTADIVVNGKSIARYNNNTLRLDSRQLGGSTITINTKGSGQVYYSWEAEGISSSGDYVEEDNYIKVRRRFFNRNGSAINENSFRQNDLIIVQITLEKTYSGTLENIAITDLLPAGFEIENPRTKEIPGMDWIKDAATPLSLDVRDDRIHFFDDAIKNKQVYYYAVRAVTTGHFKMGPVSADALYNNEYHSYHGAGTIRITE